MSPHWRRCAAVTDVVAVVATRDHAPGMVTVRGIPNAEGVQKPLVTRYGPCRPEGVSECG